jgi:hypothetical protein
MLKERFPLSHLKNQTRHDLAKGFTGLVKIDISIKFLKQ